MRPWSNDDRRIMAPLLIKFGIIKKEDGPSWNYHEADCTCATCMPDID